MVAKTIGFNWGPAGTSCSQWTGIRLADVLQHCGMQGPENKANYVCFRGPKHELPQGATDVLPLSPFCRPAIHEGDIMKRTGTVVDVPVGGGASKRVVVQGRPLPLLSVKVHCIY